MMMMMIIIIIIIIIIILLIIMNIIIIRIIKYLRVTNTNDFREKIKHRINKGNACYYSLEKI